MKRKVALVILMMCIIMLNGCSVLQDLLTLSPSGKGGTTSPTGQKPQPQKVSQPEKVSQAEAKLPYKQMEVFCTYFHYFNAQTQEQWWYPGKDPKKVAGAEPWRRNLWLGRTNDYPYIGMYNNISDREIMRWHIRLAKAAGITAFLLFVNDWEKEAPQTTLLLDVAAQEEFKIGLVEQHSYLGAAPRSILKGIHFPLLPREYAGYAQMTEQLVQKSVLPLPAETTRYLKPPSRKSRDVPVDALNQAGIRLSGMLKRWKTHPAYLRIDGKPFVTIPYMDMNLTPVQFKMLVDKISANVGEELYVVAIVPFIYWYFFPDAVPGTKLTQDWAKSGANAFTHWTPNGMLTVPQTTRLKVTKFNVKDSLTWKKDPMIPVMPGFDDDTWRPGNEPAPSIPTDNGQTWSAQLDAAIAAKPRFIFIQSWNEWHEGSEIEPSTYYGEPYLFLQILAQKLNKPWQTPPLPPKSSVDPKRVPYLPY